MCNSKSQVPLNNKNGAALTQIPCLVEIDISKEQSMGKFLGIVCQDPSDSKSNQLHVDIFRFCLYSFEVLYSIDSSKMISKFPEVSNFNRLFLKLHRFICN